MTFGGRGAVIVPSHSEIWMWLFVGGYITQVTQALPTRVLLVIVGAGDSHASGRARADY